MTETDSESRRALRELIALLQEIDERYLGDEWSAPMFGDLPDGFRSVATHARGWLLPDVRERSRAAVLPPDRDAARARCSATTPMRSTTPRRSAPTVRTA